MLIQGVLKIGGTLDGDRHGLDGDRRRSEMLIQGVQRIRGTLDGVVELNGSEVEARGRDDGCSHGGWRIRHREPVLSAVCDGNLLLGSTFAYGQHVCIWAARLHLGSTSASGQHVCIWAARLHLRHREPVQSLNAAGGRTLVGFRRSTRAEEMLEIVACA